MLIVNQTPPEDLLSWVHHFFPESQWDNALNIAWLESAWNRYACNDSALWGGGCGAQLPPINGVPITAEFSVGYFQINMCNYRGWAIGKMFEAYDNVGTAHHLWASSGWRPWYFSATKLGLL